MPRITEIQKTITKAVSDVSRYEECYKMCKYLKCRFLKESRTLGARVALFFTNVLLGLNQKSKLKSTLNTVKSTAQGL